MRAAVDLGEPALAGLEEQVWVVDRDDHLVDRVQRFRLTRLLVLLGGDFATGRVGELGRDVLAVALGDLGDMASKVVSESP